MSNYKTQRNKLKSSPVKFGAGILTVYLILTFVYTLGSVWLSRYNNWLWAGRSWDRIPVETRFSVSVHTVRGGPPHLLYSGFRVSVAGVKRPERGLSHPPPFSAENKERVALYLSSPLPPSWPVLECR